ncbi:hypothetical protein EDB84DRAFT_1681981 [Lactarius hengduanensis]|nr:hypothetical protein EDB84DRAFT_1681981 [Lactarius hengduanensis]
MAVCCVVCVTCVVVVVVAVVVVAVAVVVVVVRVSKEFRPRTICHWQIAVITRAEHKLGNAHFTVGTRDVRDSASSRRTPNYDSANSNPANATLTATVSKRSTAPSRPTNHRRRPANASPPTTQVQCVCPKRDSDGIRYDTSGRSDNDGASHSTPTTTTTSAPARQHRTAASPQPATAVQQRRQRLKTTRQTTVVTQCRRGAGTTGSIATGPDITSEMGTFGGASSDVRRKGMDSPCNDSDWKNSGEWGLSGAISAAEKEKDSDS